ncbi:MAG TPA: serine/threonine protein kinase [Candidatus Wunengus sp. YC63]|uniref:serine/threonine protein kinase n=1 Tax=unclassified Candidatus Wunengus TaxID=3367695 RepID=UPI0040280E80
MYRINKYPFNDFKCQANLHKSNYAVLINAPEKGIKYSPDFDFSEEYYLLKELNHTQIPIAYDFGQGELFRDEKFLIKQNFIVLQHINGYDLVDYFAEKDVEDNNTIEEAVKLFISICDPLQYLHSKHYVHCDLKPGHLILNHKTWLVHLIDFELSIKRGGIIKGISKEYASPEQLQMLACLKDLPRKVHYEAISSTIRLDGRTDLYSVGLILYQILTKKLWQAEKVPPTRINNHIPQKLEDIIKGLLEVNVSSRIPSAEELKKALSSI